MPEPEPFGFLIDFGKVTHLPHKLPHQQTSEYKKLAGYLYNYPNEWFEIFHLDKDDPEKHRRFLAKLGMMRKWGITTVIRTDETKVMHWFMCWELPIAPEEWIKLSTIKRKKMWEARPKHD